MKRKAAAGMLCLTLIAFAGCEETPEDVIVREKGTDAVRQYESAEDGGALREMVNAPEHYAQKRSYEESGLIIETDAEVSLPDADALNTYAVSARKVDQELIDLVTKAFFDGAKICDGSCGRMTKADYQEQITNLKKYKAEGNLDPYEYGLDEDGVATYDIDEEIERAEQRMREAPEKVEKIEVKPQLGIGGGDMGKGDGASSDGFFGRVEMGQGTYQYTITSSSYSPDISFRIDKVREDLTDPQMFADWMEGEYLIGYEGNHVTEEDVKKLAGISFEEASQIAQEKANALSMGLQMTGWDYAGFRYGEGELKKEMLIDGGYFFYFSRMLDGVPITHTAEYGGGLEDMDSTLTPWGYERFVILVGDDGVQKAELLNFYDVGDVQTKQVKLKSFEEIIGIYEQMMEVSNADVLNYEKQRTYHVRKIVLGYARVYDPVKDNASGLIVPVWDFFGEFDSVSLDGSETERNSGEWTTRSLLTVNAIDGSVIDRGLGY